MQILSLTLEDTAKRQCFQTASSSINLKLANLKPKTRTYLHRVLSIIIRKFEITETVEIKNIIEILQIMFHDLACKRNAKLQNTD